MGIIYVLTNPAMPGLVKIGKTKNEKSIEDRLRNLDNTSIPIPFECVAAWEFNSIDGVEFAIHSAFKDKRVRKSREFFRISPDQPIAILEKFGAKDVTPQDDVVSVANAEDDRTSLNEARSRRENFKFHMVSIEIGSTLTSVWDDSIICKVSENNRVLFKGETLTLSAAAKQVNHDIGKKWKAVSGPNSWKYEGKTLDDLRNG